MDKGHILQEIKRTAGANGGIPLGWRRFLSETGIRECDWLGVHWARWSDALREAGFAPNQLTIGYDKPVLLEKYARFAIELGRLPVKGDLRLKAHNDPDFPSPSTFEKRWTKNELIADLIKFCRDNVGYDV